MPEQVLRADRPDRSGMKTMVTYLDPMVAQRFKLLSAMSGRTMQDIGAEALMEWLKKHGDRIEAQHKAAQEAAMAGTKNKRG